MRILHVNFAPLHDAPARAGGVTGYMQNLAIAQRDLGHTVGALSSGTAYGPNSGATGIDPVAFRQQPPWMGIDRLEIVNSPNLAPALWQFGRSAEEGSSPELDRVFTEAINHWQADIVHIHTLEGLAASCIHAAKQAGCRVVMSLHNHHPFCPQVYLMQGRRTPCLDYQGGQACVTCESAIDIETEQQRRAGITDTPPPNIDPPPLPPIMRFQDDGTYTPITHQLIEQGHPYWEPLDNDPPPSERARQVQNDFGQRRAQMVQALSACHRVLAVSEFVRRLAISMGVDEHRVQTQPIGTLPCQPITQPPRQDGDPLRLVFVGFNNYYKGLPMLIDAIGLLPVALRRRIHLAAFGPGCPAIRERVEAIRPRLAGIELGGSYTRDDLPKLLTGRDIGVVPSVWWDNGPQTLLEFQARGLPVLGAALGGIPDRIQHGVNGLLFRGNDRREAARQIERLLLEPGLLPRLWAGARPVTTISEHSSEVVGVYAELLESLPRPRSGQDAGPTE